MREAGDPEVIDPDMIARDLPPETASRESAAGREALRRRAAAIQEGRSFLIETTLASKDALRRIRSEADVGHQVEPYPVGLASAGDSAPRAADRGTTGGHDVPEEAVRRRYGRSLGMPPTATAVADRFVLYDSTSLTPPHRKVAMTVETVLPVTPCMPERARTAVDAMQELLHRPVHIHLIDPAEWTP